MSLPRSTPSAEGIDAAGIADFLDAIAPADPHSVMIARHGRVVAEGWWAPYRANGPQLVYSLSKTFTATAIGLLVGDGALSVHDPVLAHLKGVDAGAIDTVWSRVRIEHCLSMTIGHTDDAWDPAWRPPADPRLPAGDLLAQIWTRPPDAEPGTVFAYNQVATYLLSAVVQSATGGQLSELLGRRLFAPLGLATAPIWADDGRGRELGFTGVHVTTEAVLCLAELYRRDGRWAGAQLLPAEFVRRAGNPYLPTQVSDGSGDWERGYGFSLWGCRHGYRGDGAYGQFLLVVPHADLTLAMTSETVDMQAVLDAVWAHLLPAVDRPTAHTETESVVAQRLSSSSLRARSSVEGAQRGGAPALHLNAAPAQPDGPAAGFGIAGPPLPARYTGLVIAPAPDADDGPGWLLTLLTDGGPLPALTAGDGHWRDGLLTIDGRDLPVAASAGWLTDTVFVAEVIAVRTPHRIRLVADARAATVALTWRHAPLAGLDPVWSAVGSAGGAVFGRPTPVRMTI